MARLTFGVFTEDECSNVQVFIVTSDLGVLPKPLFSCRISQPVVEMYLLVFQAIVNYLTSKAIDIGLCVLLAVQLNALKVCHGFGQGFVTVKRIFCFVGYAITVKSTMMQWLCCLF